MDKLKWTNKREGVALLITLVAVAVVMVLVSVLFKVLGDAKKSSMDTSALIQANLYYADMAVFFKKIPTESKEEVLKNLYQFPVAFAKEDGNPVLNIVCKPLTAGVNIHWLALQDNSQMQPHYTVARHLFDSIALQYNITNITRLEAMILEAISLDQKYLPAYQSRLFQKSDIMSFHQFKEILMRYQLETDDRSVMEVPWEKLLSFVPEAESIDTGNMSPELVALLFDMDIQAVKSEWDQEEGGPERIVKVYQPDIYRDNPKVFAQAFTEYARCKVSYQYAQENYGFAFNEIQGEVNHFEFYGR